MVKIALDPAMYHADLSVADEVRKAADLGYEYLELSPRASFFFWHRYPKADDAAIARGQEGLQGDPCQPADAGTGLQLVVRRMSRNGRRRSETGGACCRLPPSWNARW